MGWELTLCAGATWAPFPCGSWCCFTARRGAFTGRWFALLRHHGWRRAGWSREVGRSVERCRCVGVGGPVDRSREECARAGGVLMGAVEDEVVAGARRGWSRCRASQSPKRSSEVQYQKRVVKSSSNELSKADRARRRCLLLFGGASTRARGQSRPAKLSSDPAAVPAHFKRHRR